MPLLDTYRLNFHTQEGPASHTLSLLLLMAQSYAKVPPNTRNLAMRGISGRKLRGGGTQDSGEAVSIY